MINRNEGEYYTTPSDFLQQGDLFQLDLVAPGADEVQRIFRTKDGRHGSLVFEENCEGRVFARKELDDLLEEIPQEGFYTRPFQQTSDGQEEMVVVYSRFFRYVIIATQTCDICGQDKAALPWATVLPVIPLIDFCKVEPIPLAATHELMTLHGFAKKFCEGAEELSGADDIEYPSVLRRIVTQCAETTRNKSVKKDAKFLLKFLGRYYEKMWMFSLPADPTIGLPESYVDFTSAFTVPSAKLLALQRLRFATVADLYRIDFSRQFGEFFSRIALPKPMRPG